MIESETDPLTVSSSIIEFSSSTTLSSCTKNLIIRNNHSYNAIAYKIRTNNLEAIEAFPNYGFLKANSSLSLRIKTQLIIPFEAKLLISYGEVGEKPGEFGEVWSGLSSGKLRNKEIKVKRAKEEEINSKKEGEHHTQKIDKMRSKSLEKKQAKHSKEQESNENELTRSIQELHQKLTDEQVLNAKIKQQLEITEERLKIINQERLQIKVNKSIGIVCEDYHTSFTTLLLYGLAIFVVGYVIAQWEK